MRLVKQFQSTKYKRSYHLQQQHTSSDGSESTAASVVVVASSLCFFAVRPDLVVVDVDVDVDVERLLSDGSVLGTTVAGGSDVDVAVAAGVDVVVVALDVDDDKWLFDVADTLNNSA